MTREIRNYATYSRPVMEEMETAPLVGENIMGDLLQLIYRYQDAKRENEAAQKAEAESSARMNVIEKDFHKTIAYAYENDEATRILIQFANVALATPKSQL